MRAAQGAPPVRALCGSPTSPCPAKGLSQPSPVLVMDPVTLFETRVANVVDLEDYQDEKGVQQAHIAGAVLREWHRDRLTEGWPAARRGIKRTVRLAQSRRGIVAAVEYGLDVLGCIPAHPNRDPKFVGEQLRRAEEKVASAIAAAGAARTSRAAGRDG